jgi:hypothetical protein
MQNSMANQVNARAVGFPARGPGRLFRPLRAFENSPAIYGRVMVGQSQGSTEPRPTVAG